jgi:hypothetical protein
MKVVADISYPGLDASKNLVTDATKTVDAEDFVAGGAAIYGIYTEGGTDSIELTWVNGSDSRTWKNLSLPDNATGTQLLETPSLPVGEYALLGAVGVYTTYTNLTPTEFHVRATNGTDHSQWIPVTIGLVDEIEQIPIQMPVVATVAGPWKLQARTLNDHTDGQDATYDIEVSSSLIAITADTTSFTQNIPSRVPSTTYTEVTVGSGHSTWESSINDVDHIYTITFTTPASVPTSEHLFGVGGAGASQLLFLDNSFQLTFASGATGGTSVNSAALSPGAQYSAIAFVDAVNDDLYLWVEQVDDPKKITVLDAAADVDTGYLGDPHADVGSGDGFVKEAGSSSVYNINVFGTSNFNGTIDQNLRYYINQRPQGV